MDQELGAGTDDHRPSIWNSLAGTDITTDERASENGGNAPSEPTRS